VWIAVPNKTAASLFRVLLCSPIMTISQSITFVYSCWQRTVRNDRWVTVNGSKFLPAAARTDIPQVTSVKCVKNTHLNGARYSFAQIDNDWSGLYVMMSLVLNFSVGLRHMQQCDNVSFVHFCRCTNQRDELNIQSQTSTLNFCCITSFPLLSLPVYVLKNYVRIICIKNVVDDRLLMFHMYNWLLHCCLLYLM